MPAVKSILVYPKPGVKLFLPGSVHGFASGPVPIHPEHARALAAHVMTDDEKTAFDKAQQAEAALRLAKAAEAAAQANEEAAATAP